MKIIYLNLLFFFVIISCNGTEKKYQQAVVVQKIKYKKNTTNNDTLWVSQNDTTYFRKEKVIRSRPCSYAKLETQYELIKPLNNAYYFIYNDKKQLIFEGKYSSEYTDEGQTNKNGYFYNSKTYQYKSNGNLESIHYMVNGRSSKTELFDRKKRVSEITYYDKKTSDKAKVEIYDEGKLDETHIYTSFNNYYTVKQRIRN